MFAVSDEASGSPPSVLVASVTTPMVKGEVQSEIDELNLYYYFEVKV